MPVDSKAFLSFTGSSKNIRATRRTNIGWLISIFRFIKRKAQSLKRKADSNQLTALVCAIAYSVP